MLPVCVCATRSCGLNVRTNANKLARVDNRNKCLQIFRNISVDFLICDELPNPNSYGRAKKGG